MQAPNGSNNTQCCPPLPPKSAPRPPVMWGLLLLCWAASPLLPTRHRGRLGAQVRHLERTCTAHITAHPHSTPISTNSWHMLPHDAQPRPSPTDRPAHLDTKTLVIRKCRISPTQCHRPCASRAAWHALAIYTAPYTLSATPTPLRGQLRAVLAPAASSERLPMKALQVCESIRSNLQKGVSD